MKRGLFIVFEGVDGCGKSTQVKRLAAALEEQGHTVCLTAEPTAGPFGCKIRAHARSGKSVDPALELSWFEQDRQQHVEGTIHPALAAGQIVVCDRYYLSSVAYQGARGLSADQILAQSEARFPLPDLVLLLQLDLDEAQERLRARASVVEAGFENRAFQERVSTVFRELDLPYLAAVDASGSAEEVQVRIAEMVRGRLGVG